MTASVPVCNYDPKVLDHGGRADGISAMLRVRDGAQFLRLSLDSCMDAVDEVVAVHHQCSDDTPQILHEYAAAHPDRFKVYEYPHEVFPPGTKEHAAESAASPHTIAALCNYALARTTRRFVFKYDADQWLFPRFAEIADFVRNACTSTDVMQVWGVNLARPRAGRLGVYSRSPVCGGVDTMLFPVSRDSYFAHGDPCEMLRLPRCRYVSGGFGFWHLKFLQRHYGLHEYTSRYDCRTPGYYAFGPATGSSCAAPDQWRRRLAEFERALEVVSLEEFVALYGGKDSPFKRDVVRLRLPWPGKGMKTVHVRDWMSPLVWSLIRRFVGAYPNLPQLLNELLYPQLKARSARMHLERMSLPAESDLAA